MYLFSILFLVFFEYLMRKIILNAYLKFFITLRVKNSEEKNVIVILNK